MAAQGGKGNGASAGRSRTSPYPSGGLEADELSSSAERDMVTATLAMERQMQHEATVLAPSEPVAAEALSPLDVTQRGPESRSTDITDVEGSGATSAPVEPDRSACRHPGEPGPDAPASSS